MITRQRSRRSKVIHLFALGVWAMLMGDVIARDLLHLAFGLVVLVYMHPLLTFYARESVAEEVAIRAKQIVKEEEEARRRR